MSKETAGPRKLQKEWKFKSPDHERAWLEQKKFFDDMWEAPHGDFSKTDVNDAFRPDAPKPKPSSD